MDHQRVVIAGGSGFVGISVAHHLAATGFEIVILSRRAPRVEGPWRHVPWDGRTMGPWVKSIDGAAGLVNLAGRTVDCVKTPVHCDEILRSRVESTRVLGKACRAAVMPPQVWAQMSTAHIYGDPPVEICDETSAFGVGLAPTVARAWEEAHREAVLPAQRSVVLRTSFVLGRDRGAGNGALRRLGLLAKLGLGGTVGPGWQGISWIHETDLNRLFERALTDPLMNGVYVATSPQPVSNAEFMRELRRAVTWPKIPLGLPAFSWMVRLGAPLLLRTDPELALCGRYVVSRRLRDEEFQFRYPQLRAALREVYRGESAVSLPVPAALA